MIQSRTGTAGPFSMTCEQVTVEFPAGAPGFIATLVFPINSRLGAGSAVFIQIHNPAGTTYFVELSLEISAPGEVTFVVLYLGAALAAPTDFDLHVFAAAHDVEQLA